MDSTKIQIYFPGACLNKVVAIKAVRSISGMGLKESKRIVDESLERPMVFDAHCQRSALDMFNSTMAEIGAQTGHTQFEPYREYLEELALKATLAGDYYVAKQLVNFMNMNLPNRDDELLQSLEDSESS